MRSAQETIHVKKLYLIIILKKESLEAGQMAFILAHVKALENCLTEVEEKAKALSEQVIPVIILERYIPQ